MLDITKRYLKENYGIKDYIFELSERSLDDIKDQFDRLDKIKEYNQYKMLKAFQEERISDSHFTNSTGYGYDDLGREGIEKVYARVFKTEAALVRPHFVNGTHALGTAMFGNLRPGDTLIAVSGTPYDTLQCLIGIDKSNERNGSMKEYGINYKQIDLTSEGTFDFKKIEEELKNDKSIKMVHLQRSTGYGWRNAFTIEQLEEVISLIKAIRNDVIVFVDNCYGEFVDIKEPTEIGADLMAGSLIKNVGGGIAPTGGYIVGKKEYVDQASYRMTVPGIGGECGSTFGIIRTMLQGFFLAPHVTMEAVKGAVYCSRIMELAGFDVLPKYTDKRSDIIQCIKFGDKEKLIKFCKGIQSGSPIDSFVECEPWAMPGYDNEVIMAAGAFIQGSSIELSADAPIKEPYIGYLQGGLTFEHAKIGIMISLSKML